MEKGRTPPQQNISSCLLYYFHCFPTFRVTKKEKARREKESPSSQHSVAIHSSAGKELNGTGICQSLDRWVLLSPVSCFSPSTYGPCPSQQAFSHLKVTVHDPTGTQCSQPPLFSKGNSWNPCWEFTGLGQVKGGWKYRWKASECLIAPFLKRKACLMFTQKESEPSPSYSSSELIPMDLEAGKCLWYFIYYDIYIYIHTHTLQLENEHIRDSLLTALAQLSASTTIYQDHRHKEVKPSASSPGHPPATLPCRGRPAALLSSACWEHKPTLFLQEGSHSGAEVSASNTTQLLTLTAAWAQPQIKETALPHFYWKKLGLDT